MLMKIGKLSGPILIPIPSSSAERGWRINVKQNTPELQDKAQNRKMQNVIGVTEIGIYISTSHKSSFGARYHLEIAHSNGEV